MALSARARFYAVQDADATFRVHQVLRPRLEADQGLLACYQLTMGTLPLIRRMQETGWWIDIGYLTGLLTEFWHEKEQVKAQLAEMGHPINPDSWPQVARLLFEDLALPKTPLTKETKRPSTSNKHLQAMLALHPVVPLICDHRELTKLASIVRGILEFTHLDPGETYGRLYPRLNMTGTPQGRLSSKDPNLLAVPNRTERGLRIRKGFLAPERGLVLSADMSQIELRVLAAGSMDPAMVEVFQADGDFHADTAHRTLGAPKDKAEQHPKQHRLPAKTINFMIPMGASASGLLIQMHKQQQFDWTQRRCQQFLNDWHLKAYPGASDWLHGKIDEAEANGGAVTCLGGRKRWVPGVYALARKVRNEAHRQVMSFAMSGGAQFFMHAWEVACIPEVMERGVAQPLLQIHDDLVWGTTPQQLEEAQARLVSCVPQAMPDGSPSPVPIKVEAAVGETWGDIH